MDAVVNRLYRCLVDSLQERGSDWAERSITVAEIYQELAPYRAVREKLGVEQNADYEHALIRLLSGEGEFVRLEPPTARDELRKELASPDPYMGIYRKFAACDVWVKAPEPSDLTSMLEAATSTTSVTSDETAPDTIGIVSATDSNEGTMPTLPSLSNADDVSPNVPNDVGERAVSLPTIPGVTRAVPSAAPDGTPRRPGAEARQAPVQTPPFMSKAAQAQAPKAQPARVARTASGGTASGTANGTCLFCNQTLPDGKTVRFCPFCGMDQQRRPCSSCGEVLDRAWKYCITCGTAVEPTGTTPTVPA